jgi:MFS family permease
MAFVDAAVLPRPGSPRAALRHRGYRLLFLGSFASNIGTWMQNVALLAFADHISRDATFVGIVTFAQLGPILLLSPVAGVVADTVNRRTIMIAAAATQGLLSLWLAFIAASSHPSKALIVLAVTGIGIASSLNGPAAQATTPALVSRVDLPGAVALNSAQMNASRVIGPLIAVLPFLQSPSHVFAINALTYLFVIAALMVIDFSGVPKRGKSSATGNWRANGTADFIEGLRAARSNRVIAQVLLTVSVYSLCSLAFIYQMKGFSRVNLHLPADRFGLLFASFGLGAAAGAIAVGTTLAPFSRARVARAALATFGVVLAIFALLRSPTFAYVTVAAAGASYFVVITALSTLLQEEVDDSVRGRVMGLWMMGWAGLVPVGSLLAGLLIDRVGYRPIFLFGALVAALLAAAIDLQPTRRQSAQGPQPDSPSTAPPHPQPGQ